MTAEPFRRPNPIAVHNPEDVLKALMARGKLGRTPMQQDEVIDVLLQVNVALLRRVSALERAVSRLHPVVAKPKTTPIKTPASNYTPRNGSLSGHVLRLIEDDGGTWLTCEIVDELKRSGAAPKADVSAVSNACRNLHMRGRIAKRPEIGPTGTRFRWSALEATS